MPCARSPTLSASPWCWCRGPASGALASLDIALNQGTVRAPSRMDDAALEALRAGVPAARSLPLLAALARGRPDEVVLDYLAGSSVRIDVNPCR